jgi:hypothetical protein
MRFQLSNNETRACFFLGSVPASRALRGASPRSENVVQELSAEAFGQELAGAMGVAGGGVGNGTRGACAPQQLSQHRI